MKTFFICVIFFFSLFTYAQEPGMSVENFKKKFPGIIPGKTFFNEEIAVPEKTGGFDGTWYFNFKRDTLRDVFFSENLGGAPEQKFAVFFLKLKTDFIKKYGAPFFEVVKDTLLNEARTRINNRDTLMLAKWQLKNSAIEIGLFYTGNKKVKQDLSDMVNQQNPAPSMNYYVFTINCYPEKKASSTTDWKFFPGMKIKEVLKANPELFSEGLGISGQWQKEETIHGMKGKWNYDFKNNTLNWLTWNYYPKDIKETTFTLCMKGTKKLIADYTKKYGKPKIIAQDLKYRDPAKEMHYGYDVQKAEWKLEKYSIVITNKFFGGKGNYFFVVSIEKKR